MLTTKKPIIQPVEPEDEVFTSAAEVFAARLLRIAASSAVISGLASSCIPGNVQVVLEVFAWELVLELLVEVVVVLVVLPEVLVLESSTIRGACASSTPRGAGAGAVEPAGMSDESSAIRARGEATRTCRERLGRP